MRQLFWLDFGKQQVYPISLKTTLRHNSRLQNVTSTIDKTIQVANSQNEHKGCKSQNIIELECAELSRNLVRSRFNKYYRI